MEAKTSKEWYELVPKKFNLAILDPDGWNRSNFDISFNKELITKDQFIKRLMSSTIECDKSFFNEKW